MANMQVYRINRVVSKTPDNRDIKKTHYIWIFQVFEAIR